MNVVFLYHDALAPGGYPRDVRWLAGNLSELGVDVTVLGRPGPLNDGLGSATVVDRAESWADAIQDGPVLHAFGISNRVQLDALRGLAPGASRLVFSPLAHMMREHLRVGSALKRPAYRMAGAWLNRHRAIGHFFSIVEQQESAPYFAPRSSFIAGAGVFPDDAGDGRMAGNERYLLFFGRNDVNQKGLDLLIEGYGMARAGGLDLPLVIGGRAHGDSESFLRTATQRAEVGDSISLLGETSDEERSRLMAGADAFIFPSRWDGPPRPVREAIALGVPVLVTPGTNMAEVVAEHDAGAVIEPTAAGVRDALLRLIDAKEVERWRQNSPKLREALSWPTLARSYLSAYEGGA
ncbi:MAG TPA: glycosyltransferase family 4 protein [Actinomycetota bacterium]|nr:glycosyltransferase family 4 protein [Actinomycetota bacterium]